jgi:transitional endoplasmic reticulum ATPase
MSNWPTPPLSELSLRVIEALSRDVGRNVARLNPVDMDALGLSPGQPVEIVGRARTATRVLPSLSPDREPMSIQIDGITRGNAKVGLDEQVIVCPVQCVPASHVKLTAASGSLSESAQGIEQYLSKLLNGLAVSVGDLVRVSLFGTSAHDFKVIACEPAAPAMIQLTTAFELTAPEAAPQPEQLLVYEDIGGLQHEVGRLREVVEIPLKHPEVFERLGVTAPRAILLTGPAGVGKSLMARVVAEAAQAHFFATSGPEILNKYYHRVDTHLRDIFERALKDRPSVIFIDELERIASRQPLTASEAEKHIATELLALIDQLERNGRVVVIGSSTNSDELDPTFRRHGRFEREISVRAPRYNDRLDILDIHSRGIPLAEDVDLSRVAALTQGFVGADLSLLCQEAALIALRQKMIETGSWSEPTFEMLAEIQVTMAHFLEALRVIAPSIPEAASIEFTEVNWDDIGGLHDVRAQLLETIVLPLRSPELFARVRARPVRGVLLHGPPGTGKTLLGRALAKEPGMTCLAVKGSDVLVADVAASERAIRNLFLRAKQQAPSIIFFDEIDALSPAPPQGGAIGQAERAWGQFLSEIDGIEALRGVVVLGATNRLEMIDSALFRPGRFDLLLEVPLPDSQALKEIFQIHLRGRPVADDVELGILVKLAGGFSGADVEVACQLAATNAIKERLIEKQPPEAELLIAQRHLAAAIAEVCMQKLEEK